SDRAHRLRFVVLEPALIRPQFLPRIRLPQCPIKLPANVRWRTAMISFCKKAGFILLALIISGGFMTTTMEAQKREKGTDFHSALVASGRSPEIPEASDVYGWLVGSWNL